jgi:hypothetical protein
MVEAVHQLIDWWTGTAVPPKVSNWLKQHGNEPIQSLAVCRDPISKTLDLAIDIISKGKYSAIKNRVGYDHFFHLGLVVNGWVLEKNEQFNIRPFKSSHELMDVAVPDITIGEFMRKASEGDEVAFYRQYDAFSHNCQAMVLRLLQKNGLLTEELRKFIRQDVQALVNELPETHKTAKHITDVASLVSRLLQLVSGGRLSLAVGGRVRRRRFKGYR